MDDFMPLSEALQHAYDTASVETKEKVRLNLIYAWEDLRTISPTRYIPVVFDGTTKWLDFLESHPLPEAPYTYKWESYE